MNIFSKLFKKDNQNENVGGTEDFMMLIRVYYQATIAAQIGINNPALLPDLRTFKQAFHITTLNNKLGLAEKKHCQKILQSTYNLSNEFFKEIDNSIKKKCRNIQDFQPYLLQFQGFCQDLMMLMGNLMQWKLRLPSFFHKALRSMVEKQVHDIMTKIDWKDDSVRRACISIRRYHTSLGYSEAWITEFVHTIVMLSKKEKKPQKKD